MKKYINLSTFLIVVNLAVIIFNMHMLAQMRRNVALLHERRAEYEQARDRFVALMRAASSNGCYNE